MFDLSLSEAYESMILSVSGWRAVYDTDGVQGRSGKISKERSFLTFLACTCFENFLLTHGETALIIGRDTRPTGNLLVRIAEQSFSKLSVRVLGVAAAPEIMAHAKKTKTPFLYFSASHNPIGYNGMKFGLQTGGVLGGNDAQILINEFSAICKAYSFYAENHSKTQDFADCPFTREVVARLESSFYSVWQQSCTDTNQHDTQIANADEKNRALEHYFDFALETISGIAEPKAQTKFIEQLRRAVMAYKKTYGNFCLVYDFNGSSRAHSIDKKIFEFFGIVVHYFNEQNIAHEIIPEGDNLKPASQKMAELAQSGEHPLFALMPDCDGDRGNVVFWDTEKNTPLILSAQEVFALCVLSELSFIRFACITTKPVAVVVNGATSLRIHKIAEAFHAKVFTAEVGEANVVNLAAKLRSEGYFVRILGEGSNGGNITFPASVRDPINTVFAILRLLFIREEEGSCPFRIWCESSGQENMYTKNFTLRMIIDSLPQYTTTETQMERALLTIQEKDSIRLKQNYQKIFLTEWQKKKEEFAAQYGIVRYRVFGTLGIDEFPCDDDFSKSESGGLKILFYDVEHRPIAFIWMRSSKTEPIFRIMADIEGNRPQAEKELVLWQAALLSQADKI